MQNRLTNADSCVIILFVDYGRVPERPKGADCKSVVTDYDGSNPSPSTNFFAGMAELADAHGSGPCEGDFMQVQVLFPAPERASCY